MYPPHHLGGYELACRDTVERWRADGHEVSVLTSDVRFEHADGSDGDAIRALRIYWSEGVIVAPPIRERLRIEKQNIALLRRTLADARPDVVSVWHMGAMSLGLLTQVRRLGVPMVFVVADQWLVYGPKVDAWTRMFARRPWARPIAAWLGTVATVDIAHGVAICFASEWLRRDALEHSPLRLPPADRLGIVPWGVDNELFTPGPRRDTGLRLLCAGRVEARKGVHVAVEAMAHLPPETTLDVVGSWDDETYVDSLRARAAELGVADRITWRGLVPRSELADAYRAADVFLFPVVWEEPFGMTPVEAMASGTPVIGTGTGGSDGFLLDGVNCLRVPRGDAPALAAAVRRLSDDTALRERLVRAGEATAAYYADDVFGRELDAWHGAAATGFEARPPRPRPPLRDAIAAAVDA